MVFLLSIRLILRLFCCSRVKVLTKKGFVFIQCLSFIVIRRSVETVPRSLALQTFATDVRSIVLICSSRTIDSFFMQSALNMTCVGKFDLLSSPVMAATIAVRLCKFPFVLQDNNRADTTLLRSYNRV